MVVVTLFQNCILTAKYSVLRIVVAILPRNRVLLFVIEETALYCDPPGPLTVQSRLRTVFPSF